MVFMDRSRFGLSSIFLASSLASLFLLQTPTAQASIDSGGRITPWDESETEEYIGYDAIVNELNKQATSSSTNSYRMSRKALAADPFADVLIHAGVGFTTSSQSLKLNSNQSQAFNLKGFQAALGIDLFSRYWMAEGTARSLNNIENADRTGSTGNGETALRSTEPTANLKEFELKILFRDRFARHLGFRAGAGLSARYLTVNQIDGSALNFTTPSSVGTLGIDLFFSETFSIGLDANLRNTLIAETQDRNSYDATLRFDTHF
jgi:hypothetical protein